MKKLQYTTTATFVTEIVCSLLILLFVYTGINKFWHHIVFVDVLRQSPLLSSYAVAISWLIPAFECGIAAGLFFHRYRLWSLYGSLSLLSIFSFYILYMLLTSVHLPCSCGGFIEKLSWKQHLFFNILCIALTMLAIFNDTYHADNSIKTKRVFGL